MQRTVRVEVTFPGLRDADLKEVWGNLWAMQDDLTQAANRLMGALWQRRLGQIEAEGSERTLAYRGMTGAWNPYPTLDPIYRASKVRAHSFTLSETAELVCTRLKTDYKEILRGQKTLPTFRGGHNLPLGLRATSIKLKADGSIGLCVYAGLRRKNLFWFGLENSTNQERLFSGVSSKAHTLLARANFRGRSPWDARASGTYTSLGLIPSM